MGKKEKKAPKKEQKKKRKRISICFRKSDRIVVGHSTKTWEWGEAEKDKSAFGIKKIWQPEDFIPEDVAAGRVRYVKKGEVEFLFPRKPLVEPVEPPSRPPDPKEDD